MGYCVELNKSKFFVPTEKTGFVLARTKRSSFEFELDYNGNIKEIDLKCEKLGHDDFKIMQVIAPCVKDGSFLEFLYEDSERCRWIFKDGTVKEVWAKISWD